MTPKKVLFISSWYPNKLEPLNGNFVQRHAEAVSLFNNVEVLHAVGDFNQSEKYIFDEHISHGLRTLIIYYKNTSYPLLNFIRRMYAYKIGFRRMTKPDIVHANVLYNNMLFAVYLKKKFKIPFVITEHWTALQQENIKNTPKVVQKIAKFIGNQSSYLLPVSLNLLDSLEALRIKQPKKVISNVVDTEVFTIGKDENTIPKFLHISSLVPRKRSDRIIATAVKLNYQGYKFSLEIGGDGDFESLQKMIDEHNARAYITTFGGMSYAEVALKMQHSDCFVLFSTNETQGCVILESFSCGVPVIATRVGGVPEFVQDGFGILIDNEEQLFHAMKSIIEQSTSFADRKLLRQYVVNHFSKQEIARQFSEVYDEVLRNNK